ncbi:hypothetical protein DXG01_016139 [Tephrocybe rancida]|nr:hypothetical protein DXG01_016139 [Tephrocybe rancida]
MATVYDDKISELEVERFAKIAETAATKLSESFFPGAVAVNALPFLRYLPAWFPGAGFHKFAAECKVCTDEMRNFPFRYVKEKMVRTQHYWLGFHGNTLNQDAGIEVSGLAARLLQQKNDDSTWPHEEADIKAVAAATFTVSAIEIFFYAMVVNSDAQKKAQDEIDRVVGNKRLPDFSDRQSMPYLEAVYREVMRWYPGTPLGVSRATSEDDVYNGYFIPKGYSRVGIFVDSDVYNGHAEHMVRIQKGFRISNVPTKVDIRYFVRAMTHDETIYPQPNSFMPERFFDEKGKLNDDDTVLSFGFGRRICPGRHMASSTIWLLISTTLATFDIRKAKDEQGKEIHVDEAFSNGLVCHKLPFRCSITPRSPEAQQLILDNIANQQTS